MGFKGSNEKQLNEEVNRISELIDSFVSLCEEYQNKYNSSALNEQENLLYVEKIFTYYTFIAFKVKDFKNKKGVKSVEEMISKFNEKSSYIKALTLVKGNETIDLNSVIKDRMNSDAIEGSPATKIVKLKLPERTFFSIMKNSLITLVMNFILIFAMVGFFSWAKWTSLFDLALFIGYYSLIEIFVKNIIILIFPKLIFKTLGAILLLPMILAIVSASVFPLFIEIQSVFGFIMTAILCSLIRKFIIEYIDDKKVKKEMKNLV